MSKLTQPTSEQCSDNSLILEDHDRMIFAAWHPQWGGYSGKCLIEFGKISGDSAGEAGCFDVFNFHDGEFPREDHLTHIHYCCAEQLIEFGIKILELQMANQKCNWMLGQKIDPPQKVKIDTGRIQKSIDKLNELIT